jgi:hypothetical protein
MKSIAVSLFGLFGCIFTAVVLIVVDRFTGFSLYSFSFLFLIPVGAIICGMASASGYYFGALLLNKRPSRYIFFQCFIVSLFSLFLIYFGTYYIAEVDGQYIRASIPFIDYMKFVLREAHYLVGRGSRDVGAIGNFGYWIGVSQAIGFVVGGMSIFAFLTEEPYCHICDKYFTSSKNVSLLTSDAATATTFYSHFFDYPIGSLEFNANLIYAKESYSTTPQFAVISKLFCCETCEVMVIINELQVLNGDEWVRFKDFKYEVEFPKEDKIAQLYS